MCECAHVCLHYISKATYNSSSLFCERVRVPNCLYMYRCSYTDMIERACVSVCRVYVFVCSSMSARPNKSVCVETDFCAVPLSISSLFFFDS